MKGHDGVAEHASLSYLNSAAAGTILGAPGPGYHICVFKISGTNPNSNVLTFEDSVPVRFWSMLPVGGRLFYDYDEYGLFSLAENEPLNVLNPGAATIRLNITYEIRPTGM